MRGLLFSIIVLMQFSLFSQTEGFSKLYDLGYADVSSSLNVSNEGIIFVIGTRLDTLGRSINILLLNENGNLIYQIEETNKTYAFYPGRSNSIHSIDSNVISCGALSNYKTLNFIAVMYKFNIVDSTFKFYKFSDTTRTKFYSCNPTNDGGFIALGTTERSSGNDEFLLVKYNAQLQEEWVKTYGNDVQDEVGFYVKPMADGTYLLSGARETSNYLIHVDDTGKVLSNVAYYANYGGCRSVESKDGNIFMVTTINKYYPQINGYGSAPTLRKIDSKTMKVIWETDMFSRYVAEFSSAPIEVESGKIYISGFQLQDFDTLGNTEVVGRLACFSPDGDSLWSKTYWADSLASNYIYDLTRTTDGNFIMSGSAFGADQDVWVLKVDSNGCIIEGCGSTWVENEGKNKDSFAVYPNPFAETLQIESENPIIEIQIFNVYGKLVFQKTKSTNQITLDFLSNGIYLLKLKAATGEWVSQKVVKY